MVLAKHKHGMKRGKLSTHSSRRLREYVALSSWSTSSIVTLLLVIGDNMGNMPNCAKKKPSIVDNTFKSANGPFVAADLGV